ncbi:gamma-glutamylcyclotransferase family protein [Sphingomonas sp. BIUV-7]|uniref:Gamma-glutamylcyclotransferase family protein n=1 Tax=Sphingomonas natans TaxID=3063330 RepID=A0ABT8YBJ1_9SPHN|nr:gamma-glutamylcyclotransferase family protein [Sphingomonas sp. BIUV-7]MDO6415703.1 gamma-glutamylcyclotransferase family protein [Sphingomonas sp. BIUV-7]
MYGTLRPASRHRQARRLLREARRIGPARLPHARLFRVRHFPGLVANGGRRQGVAGDLLLLRRPERTLAWLDAYEGCAPDSPTPHPYARVVAPVRHRERTVVAIGYVWPAPTTGLRLIPSGNWLRR